MGAFINAFVNAFVQHNLHPNGPQPLNAGAGANGISQANPIINNNANPNAAQAGSLEDLLRFGQVSNGLMFMSGRIQIDYFMSFVFVEICFCRPVLPR